MRNGLGFRQDLTGKQEFRRKEELVQKGVKNGTESCKEEQNWPGGAVCSPDCLREREGPAARAVHSEQRC